ncbi:mediator of RNA polymerase II transcription subunit 30 isoform X3 [Diorhabda carinulata]|uniref:mediator of RNA polymerase II transcription subunit 30 isoform X3 n=1 Tax=Diorhabda carinulata TaxID=1163345 RepID=UPI0025A27490|nr:mediator of RNA polymerase II transcription subunit 30 isoform X3 [Diorhabda carinulata]XP_057667217.1 mediator of RNA polymerase II transcription subunit 30 isoform X3 [Diorhabda carinulata]XP_057667270.1 mediator of RNA polymerase II transcription subunit 30 isoform X3 [Diorhabda carinulata]XP_057667356.1 mediator of RNA polymerase II transcription subunit 30 isoform X3 [Diorhabda carinulata]
MAAPPHHFMQNLNNPQQSGMRSSFGLSPMQTQMTSGSMQNTLPTQMPVPMSNPMGSPMVPQMTNPMNGTMGNQMNPSINGGSPMLNQMNPHYSMNSPMNGTQMAPHQTPTQIPIQQRPMEYAANLNHHEMPQPTPGVAPTPPSVPVQQQQQQQSKEFNTASLCRLGQETVQDIVSRTQEVFQTLKQIQPPNGTPQSLNASNEKKARVQELLRTIRVLFKRLRLIYEKCNENCQLQGMEYTHIESLIPFKDELDPKHDEKKNSEAYRLACEESKEVMEQVILKNKQLKEVIDHLRRIIWEINTMLTMRKS